MPPHDYDPLSYPVEHGEFATPTAEVDSTTQRSLNDLRHCLAAVTNCHGDILAVNRRWNEFASNHDSKQTTGIGANYLRVCRNAAAAGCQDAELVAAAIEAVARGDRLAFTHRYLVSHGATSTSYFLQIAAFYDKDERRVFIAHEEM